jgi:ubiquinone/menaquinone biosynthesis C-methylase UbiE
MGRRSVRVDQHDRWVFNRIAPAYRSRPPYPGALVDRILELAGGAGSRVVDLGAGTGLLTLPLAERGAIVAAVEPAREMLAVLRARLSPAIAGRVTLDQAAAEATSLPPASFDLALVADALHWVDPELAGAEVARLVRVGGTVAVVEASFAATPFMTGLAALLAEANPKARPRPPGALRQFVNLATATCGLDPALRTERFVHDWVLDDEALAAVLASLSQAGPALGPARLDGLVERTRALARSVGGARWSRELTLAWATRRASRA